MTNTVLRIDEEQPAPTGVGTWVLPEVMSDLMSRAQKGRIHYGTYLHTDNGRSATRDAYEEVLDLAMYLKQKLMEEEKMEEAKKNTCPNCSRKYGAFVYWVGDTLHCSECDRELSKQPMTYLSTIASKRQAVTLPEGE